VLHKRIVIWSEAREGYNGLDANGKSKADVQSLWEDISLAVWCEWMLLKMRAPKVWACVPKGRRIEVAWTVVSKTVTDPQPERYSRRA
jgi:hypothetical protein